MLTLVNKDFKCIIMCFLFKKISRDMGRIYMYIGGEREREK